ncbi:hypothetical protein GCM10020360_05670 [Nonlabens tegetincola]
MAGVSAADRLVPRPPRPEGVAEAEWESNLSDPALYGGIAADGAREERVKVRAGGDVAPGGAPDGASGGAPDSAVMFKFREILVQSQDHDWLDKTLDGLSHKPLWRNDETGASISLVRFRAGSGIPLRHSHASNQFMFCLSGQYRYVPTGLVLEPGSFYWNPKGCLHGPTLAEADTVLLEVYDGPHYPTQPEWYSSPEDTI